MSCIDIERVGQRTWDQVFRRRTNPTISLPENYIENNEKIRELKKIDGLLRCTPTTVGAVIGTHVHDIKLNKNPTIFKWDDEE
jgi:hypothetical protein